MEKLGRHDPSQVIKVDANSDKSCSQSGPWISFKNGTSPRGLPHIAHGPGLMVKKTTQTPFEGQLTKQPSEPSQSAKARKV